MRVTLLGTGSSEAGAERVQSGVMVEAEGEIFLFDIGSGVLHRLLQTGVELTSINSVFITHFHIDHSSDFLPLFQRLWLNGYKKTLGFYGPPTMKEWLRGIHDVAFPYLREKVILKPYYLNETEALQVGPLSISTCPTLHGTHDTRAFRIEHEGQSVVYTGDTAPCRDVVELAKGTDVLIHECNWLDGKHPIGVHTSPSELTGIVEEIAPKKVILVHLSPEVIQNKDKVIATVGRRTDAEVILGEDLLVIEM
ncbi:MAG: MBL fold metallo-hydrolase [Candidatus Thorarchaeota archaeon]|jgi:ribonuclease BN (tRNA processing enzyme)